MSFKNRIDALDNISYNALSQNSKGGISPGTWMAIYKGDSVVSKEMLEKARVVLDRLEKENTSTYSRNKNTR